jgi:hypothetical protein
MQALAEKAADQVEEQHAKDEALLPKPLPEPDKLRAEELEQQLLQVTVMNQPLNWILILVSAGCTQDENGLTGSTHG